LATAALKGFYQQFVVVETAVWKADKEIAIQNLDKEVHSLRATPF
jgi:hypothetical protein